MGLPCWRAWQTQLALPIRQYRGLHYATRGRQTPCLTVQAAAQQNKHQSQLRQRQSQQLAYQSSDASDSTVGRRISLFTYDSNTAEQQMQEPDKQFVIPHQQAEQRKRSRTPQQHQRRKVGKLSKQQWRQQQPVLEPDPAADDLDSLAAQAAAIISSHSTSTSSLSSLQGDSLLPSPILNIPAPAKSAAGPFTAAGTAVPGSSARQPRYSVSDKLHLTKEAAKDIARRLRQAGPPKPGQPPLRVFRYGIDDLRLYKALDLAGLEGRVVVVDSMHFADAVLTTRSKRTGKAVNLAVARRAAAAAGVPVYVLRAVSAQRVLEALGPLLGLQDEQVAGSSNSSSSNALQQQQQEGFADALTAAQSLRTQPRLLRWDEMAGDGSDELLALLWGSSSSSSGHAGCATIDTAGPSAASTAEHGSTAAGSSSSHSAPGAGAAAAAPSSPRWLAWCASQSHTGPCAGAVFQAVRDADVEDDRAYMLPPNPTQRAGERHKLVRPLRHYSRIRRKQLRKYLAVKQAPW